MPSQKLKRGIVEVYIGKPEDVSPIVLGLVARAYGHNINSICVQFFETEFSETLKKFRWMRLLDLSKEETAHKDIQRIKDILTSKEYSIVWLERFLDAKVSEEDLKEIISSRPFDVELVLTGEELPKSIYNLADLITSVTVCKASKSLQETTKNTKSS